MKFLFYTLITRRLLNNCQNCKYKPDSLKSNSTFFRQNNETMKIEGDRAILKHSLWLQIIRNVSFSTLTLNEFDIDLLNLTYHVYLVNWEENDQIRLLINMIKSILDSVLIENWNCLDTVSSGSRQNAKQCQPGDQVHIVLV